MLRWGRQVASGSRLFNMELLCTEMLDSTPKANYDLVIFRDPRVLANLLSLEPNYTPAYYLGSIQQQLEPYMRKIMTTWMLEVCLHAICIISRKSSLSFWEMSQQVLFTSWLLFKMLHLIISLFLWYLHMTGDVGSQYDNFCLSLLHIFTFEKNYIV